MVLDIVSGIESKVLTEVLSQQVRDIGHECIRAAVAREEQIQREKREALQLAISSEALKRVILGLDLLPVFA